MIRLTLVACCGEKLSRIAPARELYRSLLFRKSAAWAEQLGDPWMVLSARHGLIRSDDTLAPYDCAMSSLTAEQREAWNRHVAGQLAALAAFHETDRMRVTLLAGETYAGWISLVREWCTVEQPLRGMPIGRRLQWLTSANEQMELEAC